MKYLFYWLLLLGLSVAQDVESPTRGTFHGYEQLDYTFDGTSCRVVLPRAAAEGKPWLIRSRFWGHEPQTDKALLAKGWHIAYADVSNLFGNDEAVRRWDVLYGDLTSRLGLSKRVGLIGMSRGGLIAYRWASIYPERVRSIYADAPVCDIRSWPGGKGIGKGSAGTWKSCLKALDLTEETAADYKGTPLHVLEPIVKAKIGLLHVVGQADTTVPVVENTDLLEKRVKELGGSIEVIRKEGCKHHPHSLKDPEPIVSFFLKHP